MNSFYGGIISSINAVYGDGLLCQTIYHLGRKAVEKKTKTRKTLIQGVSLLSGFENEINKSGGAKIRFSSVLYRFPSGMVSGTLSRELIIEKFTLV